EPCLVTVAFSPYFPVVSRTNYLEESEGTQTRRKNVPSTRAKSRRFKARARNHRYQTYSASRSIWSRPVARARTHRAHRSSGSGVVHRAAVRRSRDDASASNGLMIQSRRFATLTGRLSEIVGGEDQSCPLTRCRSGVHPSGRQNPA